MDAGIELLERGEHPLKFFASAPDQTPAIEMLPLTA